jgi:hypothetical protein
VAGLTEAGRYLLDGVNDSAGFEEAQLTPAN